MKQCTKCHITKPLSEYHKRSERNSYRSKCKECTRIENNSRRSLYKQTKDKNEKYQRDNITDRYVKHRLKCQNYPITNETIELKRLLILTNRLCKATSRN